MNKYNGGDLSCCICILACLRYMWHVKAVANLTEHKVIIVGLDNAGKTTILYQFLMNEVVHTAPTIGSNVEEIVMRNTHFLMWDIGGQETLRATWNSYYSNTEFVILVIDSTDRERLPETRDELYKMLSHEDLQNAAVLIFANKQDVKDSMSASEISTMLALSAIKDRAWHIQGCCALTGEGLPAGLDWLKSQVTAN
ncbi:putative ADP-ribosylation factor-like protein 5C isoform X1 [Phyllobates terribilis]|uniref:putative ADP-ribosylation factor-like protein 5C isoform X1 n=1 Tax=Phyllobates terribilis TaxID=111132 RepID=UPI003CCB53A2